MGFLKNTVKRKSNSSPSDNSNTEVNSFGEPLDKLVDGDLPWGWVTYNREFTDKIESEFRHFTKQWYDSNNGDPIKEYGSLKSLLLYIDDVQSLCDKKGECFGFWCSRILVGDNWKAELKDRLNYIESNIDELIKEYNDRVEEEKLKAEFSSAVSDDMIIEMIQNNDGILQKDFYKLFDSPVAKGIIKERLYWLAMDGKIKRTKQGNSYRLEI